MKSFPFPLDETRQARERERERERGRRDGGEEHEKPYSVCVKSKLIACSCIRVWLLASFSSSSSSSAGFSAIATLAVCFASPSRSLSLSLFSHESLFAPSAERRQQTCRRSRGDEERKRSSICHSMEGEEVDDLASHYKGRKRSSQVSRESSMTLPFGVSRWHSWGSCGRRGSGLTDRPALVVAGDELNACMKFVPKLLQTFALWVATRDAGDHDVVEPRLGLRQSLGIRVRHGAGLIRWWMVTADAGSSLQTETKEQTVCCQHESLVRWMQRRTQSHAESGQRIQPDGSGSGSVSQLQAASCKRQPQVVLISSK